jgi:hypothetical protein
MQRRNATLVQRVWIGAGFDEISEYVTLRHRIPPVRAGTAVGGVMDRLSSPSVTSANVGASRDERLGELSLMRGGTDVQRGVTAVT